MKAFAKILLACLVAFGLIAGPLAVDALAKGKGKTKPVEKCLSDGTKCDAKTPKSKKSECKPENCSPENPPADPPPSGG